MSFYRSSIALVLAIGLHTILLSIVPAELNLEKVVHNKIDPNMSLNFHFSPPTQKKNPASFMNSAPLTKKIPPIQAERSSTKKPIKNVPLPAQRTKSVEAFSPQPKANVAPKQKLVSQNPRSINKRKKIEPSEHQRNQTSDKMVPMQTPQLIKSRQEPPKKPANILNETLSRLDKNGSNPQSTNSEKTQDKKQPTNEKNNTKQSESDYIEYVKRTLDRNKTYPARALRYEEEGNVMITFQILKTGALTELRIKSSSGFPSLDRQAMQIVKKSSPFKHFPPNFTEKLLKIEVPMEFKLR